MEKKKCMHVVGQLRSNVTVKVCFSLVQHPGKQRLVLFLSYSMRLNSTPAATSLSVTIYMFQQSQENAQQFNNKKKVTE